MAAPHEERLYHYAQALGIEIDHFSPGLKPMIDVVGQAAGFYPKRLPTLLSVHGRSLRRLM